jgi:hypothetical protein
MRLPVTSHRPETAMYEDALAPRVRPGVLDEAGDPHAPRRALTAVLGSAEFRSRRLSEPGGHSRTVPVPLPFRVAITHSSQFGDENGGWEGLES